MLPDYSPEQIRNIICINLLEQTIKQTSELLNLPETLVRLYDHFPNNYQYICNQPKCKQILFDCNYLKSKKLCKIGFYCPNCTTFYPMSKELKIRDIYKELIIKKIKKREYMRNYREKKYANETPEDRKQRLALHCDIQKNYQDIKLKLETPEDRDQRLAIMRLNYHKRVLKETPKEREQRLAQKRISNKKYQSKKRQQKREEL